MQAEVYILGVKKRPDVAKALEWVKRFHPSQGPGGDPVLKKTIAQAFLKCYSPPIDDDEKEFEEKKRQAVQRVKKRGLIPIVVLVDDGTDHCGILWDLGRRMCGTDEPDLYFQKFYVED